MIWRAWGNNLTRVGLAFAPALYLLGCTSAEIEAPEPVAHYGPAVYQCRDDMQLTIRRASGAVRVHSPRRGLELDLPAAPPGQDSRFGSPPYALVVEGGEALWMVSGKEPVACTR